MKLKSGKTKKNYKYHISFYDEIEGIGQKINLCQVMIVFKTQSWHNYK